MWFIFGMIVGAGLSGSPQQVQAMQQMLGGVPIRCLMALDEGDESYKACRWASLTGDMAATSMTGPQGYSLCYNAWTDPQSRNGKDWGPLCDRERAIRWEIAALKNLAKAAAEAQAARKP